MEWHEYELYLPVRFGLHSALSRKDARVEYENLMAQKEQRIVLLADLVGHDGVTLDGSDESVQALNDWFIAHAEEDEVRRGFISGRWVSVAIDIALYLGETLIVRHPNLRWDFYTWGGKRADGYHQAVIMGFSTEDPKFHTNLALEAIVVGSGNAIVLGEPARNQFVRLLAATGERA
jgi:hypothetical protein